MKRILIYSKKCQSSSNLIVIMQNMNLLLNFDMVCIDELIQQRRPLPPNIKTVPALILPELNSILQGRETFEWVEKMRINMIKMNISKNAQTSGPNGFTHVEMSGLSDNFAYTMTDLAQPKSYLPVGKDNEYAIYTGKEVGNKIGSRDLDKLIKESESKRNEQDKNIDEIYDQSRKDAILNHEKQKIMQNMC